MPHKSKYKKVKKEKVNDYKKCMERMMKKGMSEKDAHAGCKL